MSDKEIIEYLRQNKYGSALNGIYNILPAIKKYIEANSGTTNDAQDIFQDALVILCKKVQSENFVLTVPLKTYVFAVVKNCWMQELRKRKKLPAGELFTDIAHLELNEEPGFVFAKAAFELLEERCRQLLLLFYFKKENYKTIAAAMAFSDEKVAKNQKYRCLQKAKENYMRLSKNSDHE